MKRKNLIWVVLALLALAAAALILFNPFTEKIDNVEGNMSVICPVNPYHVGDQIKSPVLLRPKEECSFVDANNCQFYFTNTGAYTIPQGSLVEVTRQKIEGAMQYVEVRFPQ